MDVAKKTKKRECNTVIIEMLQISLSFLACFEIDPIISSDVVGSRETYLQELASLRPFVLEKMTVTIEHCFHGEL
jgi:hypothetical protein